LNLGRLEEARDSYEAALQVDPSNAKACRGLGNVLHAQGAGPRAISLYKRAIELDAGDVEHYVTLGMAYQQSRQWRNALDTFRQGSRCQPDRADLWVGTGKALLELGRIEEAADAFRTALKRTPHLLEPHGLGERRLPSHPSDVA